MPTLANNKKGLHDHSVIEEFEAGVVLTGAEVKSTRAGQITLKGSYISIDQSNEAWLVGAHISPYRPASSTQKDYDPDRKRKLILHKKEIDTLRGKEKEKGLTIIPISVYTKGSLIKVKLAIAKGKKMHDKRETLKKRDVDRDIRRAMRQKP